MTSCLIALGSNLGDRCAVLDEALRRLDAQPGVRVLARSAWFHTRPIGGPPGQEEFVNAAACLETALAPAAMWEVLQNLERLLGRERRARWEARRVDLDLLLYGEQVLQTPQLTIPHPRMAFRRFVLEPAVQVAPQMRHPVLGWTLQRLLDHLQTSPTYIALTGPPAGKGELARRVAETSGLRVIVDPHAGGGARRPPPEAGVSTEAAFLRRRAAVLEAQLWPPDSAGAISDFWLGQAWAYDRLQSRQASGGRAAGVRPETGPGAQDSVAELQQAWRSLQSHVISPQLIVLLQVGNASPRGDRRPPEACPAEPSYSVETQLTVELRELLWQGQHGPFLFLNAAQPEEAFSEVAAAVEAMK